MDKKKLTNEEKQRIARAAMEATLVNNPKSAQGWEPGVETRSQTYRKVDKETLESEVETLRKKLETPNDEGGEK